MNAQTANRLHPKTTLHAIQVELQSGYDLSPIEAQVLARRVQQLVDEQTGLARQLGQITYQAIAIDEPPGKPLKECRKVPVHLTLMTDDDAQVWIGKGPRALRRLRMRRIVYEASMQGGALSQEDVACVLGISLSTVRRAFAHFRERGESLPSRGEIRDIGRGVSHKIPVVRKYVRDLSFSRISRELGNHGIRSMARYLRHFALVMILENRGLTPEQMESVIGISVNLINQYLDLYDELNVPEHVRTLERLKRTVLQAPSASQASVEHSLASEKEAKGGLS
jgi:transcription initiation factor IIE alpha subunit